MKSEIANWMRSSKYMNCFVHWPLTGICKSSNLHCVRWTQGKSPLC